MSKTGLFIGISRPMSCIYGNRYKIVGEGVLDTYRVIDESGEGYLYKKSSFVDIIIEQTKSKRNKSVSKSIESIA